MLHRKQRGYSLEKNDVAITEESCEMVLAKINELETLVEATQQREELRQEFERQLRSERQLHEHAMSVFQENTYEDTCVVEFNINDFQGLINGGYIYTKEMLLGPSKEVNFRALLPEDKKLMQEAMSREVSEVLRSQVLRAIQEHVPEEELRARYVPMRWLLTWKPLTDPEPPPAPKAKARVVLIGYKHPGLAKRDNRTGKP